MNINEIYEKEKIINQNFKKKYDYTNPEIFHKQVLELIVELSELAYETKCFKYWKNDKPSEAQITVAEYADCLMIILSFCDLANISIENLKKTNETDMVKLFIHLNSLASQITMNLEPELLLSILTGLLNMAKLLNFSEEELEQYCHQKMDKTLQMICNS